MGNSEVEKTTGFNYVPRLGMTKIDQAVDAQTNQIFSIIRIKRPVKDQNQMIEWKRRVQKIDSRTNRQVLFLPLVQNFQKVGLCGSTGTVQIVYQDFTFVFENQIENRKRTQQFFQQAQLWKILQTLLNAGLTLEKIQKRIGSIHPANILMNKKGQIRIICSASFPGSQMDGISNLLANEDLKAYLAPEELQIAYQRQVFPTKFDICKAEVFSIGMTILSAANLKNLDYIYDNYKCSIDTQQLESLIVSVSQRYSLNLAKLLALMLAVKPDERLKCSQIIERISSFKKHADNKKQRTPNKPNPQSSINSQLRSSRQKTPNQTKPSSNINSQLRSSRYHPSSKEKTSNQPKPSPNIYSQRQSNIPYYY